MKKCNVITPSGIPCKNVKMKDANHCYAHRFLEIGNPKSEVTNTECPICLECNNLFILNCDHAVHIRCIENSNKMECPMCRAEIHNLPSAIKRKINKNIQVYKQEIEQENMEALVAALREEQGNDYHPANELVFAIHFLINAGIPCRYIPDMIALYYDEHFDQYPTYRQGLIVIMIIQHVFKMITEDIERSETSETSEASDEDTSDTSEASDEDTSDTSEASDEDTSDTSDTSEASDETSDTSEVSEDDIDIIFEKVDELFNDDIDKNVPRNIIVIPPNGYTECDCEECKNQEWDDDDEWDCDECKDDEDCDECKDDEK